MRVLRCSLVALFCSVVLSAQSASIVILRFQNNSTYPDLNWVGESISETLRTELSQADQIVLDRSAMVEGIKRLGLRQDANYTKASIIRIGQSLDADFIVYGSYDVKLAAGVTQLKDSSIQIGAQFIDLRRFQSGPDVSEAGKLADLSRYQQHLAWQALKYFYPRTTFTLDQFLAPAKLIRLDAQESYIRGLLALDKEQQQKWFLQAANLDPHFISPAYELGKLYLERKDFRQSLKWFQGIPPGDTRYPEARFRMGLAAYQAGDYTSAAAYFTEVSNLMPLNEVYNNLAAAEDQINQPTTIDDFRRALEGDANDTVYLFNLGAALLRRNLFEEAQQRLQAVVDRAPGDAEADDLLGRAEARESNPPGTRPLVPARLKTSMDSTAFRQLKAMLRSTAAK